MMAAEKLARQTDVQSACLSLGVPKATYYRWQEKKRQPQTDKPIARSPLALSEAERQQVLDVLNSERFIDYSPGEAYAILLDEGRYYCSIRTLYRILADANELRERRQQRRDRSQYTKPELLATAPNQVWSWDITKLKGPQKWSYFHLYSIIDIFSRYTVGWMVADRESAALAERLISQTCSKQGIQAAQLTIHADRGASMKSKLVAQLLADLGITKTHSRPYTSDDNPFSEAQFKTLKYCPEFPGNFGCIEDAKGFCRRFFSWYNNEHRHSGINWLTPKMVHYGTASQVLKKRNETLDAAFKLHPQRFKGRQPSAGELHKAVWINPPSTTEKKEDDMAA